MAIRYRFSHAKSQSRVTAKDSSILRGFPRVKRSRAADWGPWMPQKKELPVTKTVSKINTYLEVFKKHSATVESDQIARAFGWCRKWFKPQPLTKFFTPCPTRLGGKSWSDCLWDQPPLANCRHRSTCSSRRSCSTFRSSNGDAHLLGVAPSDEMALALTPGLVFGAVPGTLARAPISGGTPREVADDIAAADWTSDGKRLAVVRAKAGF
jgi:hypothetical protein